MPPPGRARATISQHFYTSELTMIPRDSHTLILVIVRPVRLAISYARIGNGHHKKPRITHSIHLNPARNPVLLGRGGIAVAPKEQKLPDWLMLIFTFTKTTVFL